MATIKDIARALVERHKMKVGASEEFLQKLVEVINEGLMQDRVVKIKGFGTFKLQEVKERKSVNVNTGESVIIAAHDKVTFTPDNVMRDIVNKPFAHFETVIVDGVPEEKPAKVEEKPAKVEEKSEKAEEPVKVVEKPAKVKEPVKVAEPVKPETPETPDTLDEPEHHYVRNVLLGVLLAAICFGLGFFAKNGFTTAPKEEPTTPAKPTVVDTVKADTVAKPAPVAPVEKETAEVDEYEQYNKDPRVKYGAYKIVGLDQEVTVQQGQTLKGISKAYLGPDMECYVEAFNANIKEVQKGDKVRIPRLELKKKKRKE